MLSPAPCSSPNGLPAGAVATCAYPFPVPATLALGNYYVGAIADSRGEVTESDEANNTRVSSNLTSLTASLVPDLLIDALTAPATAAIGSTMPVSMTVRNQAAATATSFRVGFYYSADQTITTADIYSGTSCNYPNGMGASASDTCAGTVIVPSTLPAGIYYVGAIADDQARVSESSEANNTKAASNTTTASGAVPDLVISELTAASTGTAGGGLNALVRVVNQGAATAAPFRVRFYFSVDQTVTTSDFATTYYCNVDGLGANETKGCAGDIVIPATLPGGTYWLGGIADIDGSVAESNETNNSRAAAGTTTVSGGGADLVITAMTADASASAGGPITVAATVKNQGAASALAFKATFYFSPDATISTADVSSNYSCSLPQLAANTTYECAGTILVPASLAPGNYYVGAIADALDQVAESDETNNTRGAAGPTAVAIAAPDLVVESLTAPATGNVGGSIIIGSTVRNRGSATSKSINLGFYFSADATITPADARASLYCDFSGLGANSTNSCAGPIDVPPGLTPGTYYVGAIADPEGEVQESDETNNARASATTTAITVASLNLRIDAMHLTQAAQRLSGTIGMVANRDAYLRVFVRASQGNTAAPEVRVRFYQNGALVETRTITAGSGSVVTTIDQGSLASSWNLLVPAARIQPGLSILADVDPTQQIMEGDETDNSYPYDGTPRAITVSTPPTFNVRFVPIATSANGLVGNVTDGNKSGYLADALKLFPIGNSDSDLHVTYTTSVASPQNDASLQQILGEISALRVAEGSTGRHYFGILRNVPNMRCGFASIRGLDVIMPDVVCGGIGAAHELGHNFGLNHAPCGDPDFIDPSYPYANGSIGIYGLDVATQQLKLPTAYNDVMGYCYQTSWISDYSYARAMVARATLGYSPPRQETGPALLVWGSIRNGEVVLEPIFRVETRASLPREAGPYAIEGVAPDGTRVFSFSFAGEEIADGPSGARTFAFAIPVTWDTANGPVTIRAIDPNGTAAVRSSPRAAPGVVTPAPAATVTRTATGRATVTWNAAAWPMAMVREATTGEVLSFARGGMVTVATTAAELEVLLSDGAASTPLRVTIAP